VNQLFQGPGTVIFEGAQGVLLDEWFGFHPHTTWSTTTFANAQALLDESAYEGERTRVGVLRTYFTRHGPGPFVSEDPSLRRHLPEPHNADAGWQGRFRVGAFDAVAARYALAVAGGADWLALTHLDRLPLLPPRVCTGYRLVDSETNQDVKNFFAHHGAQVRNILVHPPPDLAHQERLTQLLRRCHPGLTPLPNSGPEEFAQFIQSELRTPVGLLSFGPTSLDFREKKERRDRLRDAPPVSPFVRATLAHSVRLGFDRDPHLTHPTPTLLTPSRRNGRDVGPPILRLTPGTCSAQSPT
jgi:adenylosuccinate synthase